MRGLATDHYPTSSSKGRDSAMSKRRDKKKHKKEDDSHFILIEGHVLNEKTGVLEPYKKKLRWYPEGRCGR
jgi:hypothetical protein